MPEFYIPDNRLTEEEVAEKEKNRKRCDGLRENLLACVTQSKCVQVERITPRECIKMNHESVSQCQPLVGAFFECKRSLVDMRRRFRGPRGY